MSITARTITANTITARSIIARTITATSDAVQRCISYFNGTTAYAVSTARIIDLDAVDPSFTLKWWGNLEGDGSDFSQNVSYDNINIEFYIYTFANNFKIVLGGNTYTLLSNLSGNGYIGYRRIIVEYKNSTGQILTTLDDVLISTVAVTIGVKREPTAKFKYMTQSKFGVDVNDFYKAGYKKDVEIITSTKHIILAMNECADESGNVSYIDTGGGGFNATGFNIETEDTTTVVTFEDEYVFFEGRLVHA